MKKLLLTLVIVLCCTSASAQDKIVMRDSTSINAKIVESNDDNVIFTYPSESMRNTKAKKNIAYIVYASGRKEECTKGIAIPKISDEDDWEKVIVSTNREDVSGLTKVKSISVSAGNGGVFNKADKAHDSAIRKLQKKTAELGCGIVLITSDNFGGDYNNISSIAGEAYK